MALVAFLASVVGPRVAASCAHAALGVLSEDNYVSSSQLEAPVFDNSQIWKAHVTLVVAQIIIMRIRLNLVHGVKMRVGQDHSLWRKLKMWLKQVSVLQQQKPICLPIMKNEKFRGYR